MRSIELDTPELNLAVPNKDDYIVKQENIDQAEKNNLIDVRKINHEEDSLEGRKIAQVVVNSQDNDMSFKEAVSLLEKHGSNAISNSARVANKILERSTTSFSSTKKKGSKDSHDVSSQLLELRNLTDELAPTEKELGMKKFMGLIPGKRKLDKFFQRNENAGKQIEAIVEGLERGKNQLLNDNAVLTTERGNMYNSMQELAKSRRVLDRARDAIQEKIDEYTANGDMQKANDLKAEVLHKVEKRRMDLTTQFAVSAQAYMTIQLIEDNNKGLVEGVNTAQNVTVVALRNAVMVAHALENQRKVIEGVKGVREKTGQILERNAEMLKSQTNDIKEINSSSAVSVEALQKSFDAIRETADAIDRFKVEAVDTMSAVTDQLSDQIQRAQGDIQRSLEREKMAAGELEG